MQAQVLPKSTFTKRVRVCKDVDMDVYEIRRINTRRLADSVGGISALAERLGKSQGQISHIIGTNPIKNIGPRIAREIEAAFSKDHGWLDALHTVQEDRGTYNISEGPPLRGRVPLISWVQAGHAAEAIDLLATGEGEDWIETTVQVRTHTYALRVEGDSMAPEFPPGSLIVVEPDMAPEAGDFVIAKNGDNEVTFKQLIKDGADWYLKPLNDRYPIKPLGSSSVIGVVRESIRRFR